MTLAEKLSQAQSALHKLQTGTALASVGFGDRRIDYTPADIGRLTAYIASLTRQRDGRRRNHIGYITPV